jgi:acetyl-CoA synthetase
MGASIEVQQCLAEHPLVRECAVLTCELSDRRMGLRAFVVMKERLFDAGAATRLLQDYVKRKLLPYKYPRIIQFLPELPKTGTDKVDRQALSQMIGTESSPTQLRLVDRWAGRDAEGTEAIQEGSR